MCTLACARSRACAHARTHPRRASAEQGADQEATFDKIHATKLKFPAAASVSKDAKKLLKRLLSHSSEKRLNHAGPIKRSKFFKGLKWPRE